jgi:calcium-dependent protein kinase
VRNPTSLLNEINIMGRLDHPHVVKLYDTYEDADSFSLVMEYFFSSISHCKGGELYQRLSTVSTFDEEHARYVFRQMVEAVSYLHSQKVVHRDLKLENFLLRNKEGWEVALIDFGLSFLWNNNARQEMTAQGQQRVVGTAYYLAPEVIARNYD